MDLSDGLAVYGAVVATAATAWQAWSHQQANTAKVSIATGQPLLFTASDSKGHILVPYMADGVERQGVIVCWSCKVDLVNTRQRAVQLTGVSVQQAGADWADTRMFDSEAGFPRRLEPGDGLALWVVSAKIGPIEAGPVLVVPTLDIELPVDIIVDTAGRRSFESVVDSPPIIVNVNVDDEYKEIGQPTLVSRIVTDLRDRALRQRP